MPLSEDEQRILREIEDQLYESDPALANEVRTRTVNSSVLRRIRLAAVGMVVSLALLTAAVVVVPFGIAEAGAKLLQALGVGCRLRGNGTQRRQRGSDQAAQAHIV